MVGEPDTVGTSKINKLNTGLITPPCQGILNSAYKKWSVKICQRHDLLKNCFENIRFLSSSFSECFPELCGFKTIFVNQI